MTIKIAIDGPAGAGKSTVARSLSKRLGFIYIDTGAMYRALTYKLLEDNIDLNKKPIVIDIAKKCDIKFFQNKILLNKMDVTEEIRTPSVSRNVSIIAKIPEVREIMVKLQRSIADVDNVVMDGRDITTVVLPDAQYKFYITATSEVRAKRRYDELKLKGIDVSFEETLNEIKLRDKTDIERKVSPLTISDDSIVIDTTFMTVKQVVDKIYDIIVNWQINKGELYVLLYSQIYCFIYYQYYI